MFKFIKRWRERRRARRWMEGYRWAYMALLNGATRDSIYDQVLGSRAAFDLGARQALINWIRRHPE